LFKKNIENLFQAPFIIFGLFIINGLILISTYFAKKGSWQMQDMGYGRAILIGLAQTVAILPGISRSGSTIAAAFFLKIKPEESARFSFLLGLPVIFGAFLLELLHVLKMPAAPAFSMEMLLGMLIAFVTGLLSLKILFWFVKKTVLFPFGIYTLLLGILGFLLF
jgi:undecaprenyl-diphosphatase